MAKNNSFANFGLKGRPAAVCKCVVLWGGFPSSFCGGRKKQNKFPSNLHCPIKNQKAKSFLISILSLPYLLGSLSFYTCCQLGYRFNCLNTHNYLGVDSIIIYSYKSICISILLGNRSITIQQVKLIKKIKLLLCKIQKHRDVSVILFPLRKLRSTRITDLVFTSAKRLSSSIPLALHSGHKLLTLQIAAVFAPLMILVPARRTVNGPQFASHPYPAVFAALTRRRK